MDGPFTFAKFTSNSSAILQKSNPSAYVALVNVVIGNYLKLAGDCIETGLDRLKVFCFHVKVACL